MPDLMTVLRNRFARVQTVQRSCQYGGGEQNAPNAARLVGHRPPQAVHAILIGQHSVLLYGAPSGGCRWVRGPQAQFRTAPPHGRAGWVTSRERRSATQMASKIRAQRDERGGRKWPHLHESAQFEKPPFGWPTTTPLSTNATCKPEKAESSQAEKWGPA